MAEIIIFIMQIFILIVLLFDIITNLKIIYQDRNFERELIDKNVELENMNDILSEEIYDLKKRKEKLEVLITSIKKYKVGEKSENE